MPVAFWLGRICEHFGCLPSQAYAEWRRWPPGFLEEVIESLQYRDAKAVVDSAPATLPDSPLVRLAQQIEFELVNETLNGESAPHN